MQINEARRLKELERENREIKEMLAESLLKNRVLEAVCEKNCKPGPSASGRSARGGYRAVLSAAGLPILATGSLNVLLSGSSAHYGRATVEEKATRAFSGSSKIRLSADRSVITSRRLANRQAAYSTLATDGGFTGSSF